MWNHRADPTFFEDVTAEGEQDRFEVEAILDQRLKQEGPRGGKWTNLYLVKWRGYPGSANSWVPLENLDACPKELDKFYAQRAS